MEPEALFREDEVTLAIELIYDADKSLMRASDLGEAILGMTTCLRIAGRSAAFDFEDVYVSPLEEGSVKAVFRFVRRHKNTLIVGTVSGATGTLLSTLILAPFQLIGQYGLPALKQPSAEVMATVDKKVLEMCMNGDYRKGATKVARPINEVNQKVTIKVDSKSYEINCDNQYKFITEDEEPILPNLVDGETVTITGQLTRLSLDQNDLGFLYKGRRLSIKPQDRDKTVGTEFHQFFDKPKPLVTITGQVYRDSFYVVPRIGVIIMVEFTPAQTNMFDGDASGSAVKK
jgi:hypothetical protein